MATFAPGCLDQGTQILFTIQSDSLEPVQITLPRDHLAVPMLMIAWRYNQPITPETLAYIQPILDNESTPLPTEDTVQSIDDLGVPPEEITP